MWWWDRFGGQSDSFNKHGLRSDHESNGFEWRHSLIVEFNYELFAGYLRERDAFTGLDPGVEDHSVHRKCARRRNR